MMLSKHISIGFILKSSGNSCIRSFSRSGKKRVESSSPTPADINPAYSYHCPVMKDECCDNLNIKPGGVYVDCTLGGGGHTKAILDRGGHVIGIDQDPDAINRSKIILHEYIASGACEVIQSNFRHIKAALAGSRLAGPGSGRSGLVDGVLMDLGVSSFQINEGSRGFAFGQDGPLDMRMSKGESSDFDTSAVDTRISAFDIINTWDATAIADVLYNYGDEVRSRAIARHIVLSRPLHTTGELVNVIAAKASFEDRSKTLARCFQALRIVVNDEIGALEDALSNMHQCIRHGGRFVVMSYHSLEDRRVKNLFRTGNLHGEKEEETGIPAAPRSNNKYRIAAIDPREAQSASNNPWKPITKRAVTPSETEIELNRRARSAKLRVAEQVRLHEGENNSLLSSSDELSTAKPKRKVSEPKLGAKQLAKQKRQESKAIFCESQ